MLTTGLRKIWHLLYLQYTYSVKILIYSSGDQEISIWLVVWGGYCGLLMLIVLLLPSSTAIGRLASLYPSCVVGYLFAVWIRKIFVMLFCAKFVGLSLGLGMSQLNLKLLRTSKDLSPNKNRKRKTLNMLEGWVTQKVTKHYYLCLMTSNCPATHLLAEPEANLKKKPLCITSLAEHVADKRNRNHK